MSLHKSISFHLFTFFFILGIATTSFAMFGSNSSVSATHKVLGDAERGLERSEYKDFKAWAEELDGIKQEIKGLDISTAKKERLLADVDRTYAKYGYDHLAKLNGPNEPAREVDAAIERYEKKYGSLDFKLSDQVKSELSNNDPALFHSVEGFEDTQENHLKSVETALRKYKNVLSAHLDLISNDSDTTTEEKHQVMDEINAINRHLDGVQKTLHSLDPAADIEGESGYGGVTNSGNNLLDNQVATRDTLTKIDNSHMTEGAKTVLKNALESIEDEGKNGESALGQTSRNDAMSKNYRTMLSDINDTLDSHKSSGSILDYLKGIVAKYAPEFAEKRGWKPISTEDLRDIVAPYGTDEHNPGIVQVRDPINRAAPITRDPIEHEHPILPEEEMH